MSKRLLLAVAASVLVLSGAVTLASSSASTHHSAAAVTGTWEVYTAPYNCGEFSRSRATDVPEGPYAPGFYQTTINVHYTALPPTLDSQSQTTIVFYKKAILDYAANDTNAPRTEGPFEQPNPYSTPLAARLAPDAGMLIDCQDIRGALLSRLPSGTTVPKAPTFIEGDVVIMVPPQSASTGKPLAPLTLSDINTANSFNCAGSATTCAAAGLARTGITESVENITPVPVSNP